MTRPLLALLHLCDSLFPIGGFGYSDGLEAATTSAALRLMRIGQTDAHARLASALGRVSMVVDAMATRARPESFTPAMDMSAMTQQYLHSRLFRS